MVTIQDLIKDEQEAIEGYNTFLSQGVCNPKMIPIVKRIIRDEERHIRELKLMQKMKVV